MDRKQTFTDSEIIQDVNKIEDQVIFSRRARFFKTIRNYKKINVGFSRFKKVIPTVHDIYDKWANI